MEHAAARERLRDLVEWLGLGERGSVSHSEAPPEVDEPAAEAPPEMDFPAEADQPTEADQPAAEAPPEMDLPAGELPPPEGDLPAAEGPPPEGMPDEGPPPPDVDLPAAEADQPDELPDPEMAPETPAVPSDPKESSSDEPESPVISVRKGRRIGPPTDVADHMKSAVPQSEPRYANIVFVDGSGLVFRRLRSGVTCEVQIGIGSHDPRSAVTDRTPFPDHLLPQRTINLDVVLSSVSLAVGTTWFNPAANASVKGQLRLQLDRSPAITLDGAEHLRFYLRRESSDPGEARVAFYFRGVVVQSQKITVSADGKLAATTDFTISETLGADIEAIEPRPRVSIIANESAGATHEFVVRAAVGSTEYAHRQMAIDDESLSRVVSRLRTALTDAAPTRRVRSARELERDLRELAPLGWDLYSALDPALGGPITALAEDRDDVLISIALTSGKRFTVPWAFLYDIYLEEGADLRVCDSVGAESSLADVAATGRAGCPYRAERWHVENTLCPFGFWGVRYQFEQLLSARDLMRALRLETGPHVAVALTNKLRDTARRDQHINELTAVFCGAAERVPVMCVSTKTKLRELMQVDLPITYFLCHGTRDNRERRGTRLGIGSNDTISPQDLTGWVQSRLRTDGVTIWTDPRPLIFINACESTALDPEDLVGYASTLVGSAHAAAVVGTEVRVDQTLAMEAAEIFFRRLVTDRATFAEALRHMRLVFLADRNLLGLVYTAFGPADLALST
jgi:hypothetical protein